MQAVELNDNGLQLNTLVLNPEAEETIVMIHGMFGNLAQFYLTIAPELSRHFRVVMYDLRSHGKSSKEAQGYDLITLTDDLKSLLDALNINKCHLLGFSYGALIALKCTMRFQNLVSSVIAIEIPPKSLIPDNLKGDYDFNDFMAFASTLAPRIQENFLRSKRQIEKNYKIYDYIYNWTTFIEDLNHDLAFTNEEYAEVKVPVFLLFGEKSPCLPELLRVYDWIEDKYLYMDKEGHGFFMDKPALVSQEITNFIMQRFSITKEESIIKK